MRTKISQLSQADIGKKVTVKGWIKSARQSKSCAFIALNDGSDFEGLQVVIDPTLPKYDELIPQLTTAASVAVTGTIVQSPGKEQAFELKADGVELIGACPADEYPLQKKHHTLEFLRTIAHLRPELIRSAPLPVFATHLPMQRINSFRAEAFLMS